eukprot:scaffold4568_cov74-Cyclotella_meneghiniana.AAC.5
MLDVVHLMWVVWRVVVACGSWSRPYGLASPAWALGFDGPLDLDGCLLYDVVCISIMQTVKTFLTVLALLSTAIDVASSFATVQPFSSSHANRVNHHPTSPATNLASRRRSNSEDKFSPQQRIESVKTGVIGALTGGIAATPFIALHDIPSYGLGSWEFDTDMGAIQSALFAIVYRYCVRENDDNGMLNMGIVGAFVAVRTLARVRVPGYCTAAPLDCGDPLGYFDWDMLQQLLLNGIESVVLFGAAAAAMEFSYERNWISKFPN